MAKSLDEMSFGELGRLFPIILSDYNPAWPALYSAEKALIESRIGENNLVRISHYGSTSIPGITAKPTIDILLEVSDDIDKGRLISSFADMGYGYDPQPKNPAPHMMFMKGYTPQGFSGQVYHVHVRYSGDWDELYFRDYLFLHPDVALQYAALKRQLRERYEYDREAYTRGKTGFIRAITRIARDELSKKSNP